MKPTVPNGPSTTKPLEDEGNRPVTEFAELLPNRVMRLVRSVEFLNYRFHAKNGHGGVYLQGMYLEADIYTHKQEVQYTRKWLISPHMTDTEIIMTAFKLCLTSMEHKTRESFTYKGARIFGPHFDVEDLVRLCKDGKEDAGGRLAEGRRKAT